MLAIVLGLLSSFCFAMAHILVNRGLSGMDYFTGVTLNVIVNTLLLWVSLIFFPGLSEIWQPANLIFVASGLLVPGFARFFIYKGIARLGASVSSCLISSAPVFAILSAFFFLKERPAPTTLAGALGIVAGIVCLSWRGQTKTWRTRDLAFPLIAAFFFAIRDNLVRFGLLIVRSPILGAAIAATTSAFTLGIFYVATSGHARLGQATSQGWLWFSASGFFHYLAYVFMYLAYNAGEVAIVSPLVNGSAIFVPALAYVLLRDIERITVRKVVATLLVVAGVFLISWEKL